MSAILSSLTAYVDEQRLPLISKLGLETKSAKEFEQMYGVKGEAALNLIDVEGYFQNGKACGWHDSGSTKFTQRNIKVVPIKVETSICQNAMADYWMNYQIGLGANRRTLPVEEEICNKLVNSVNEKIEKLIWLGDTSSTGDMAFNEGLIRLLDQTTGATGGAVNVTASSAATVYERVLAVYKAIPSAALAKSVIYVSIADFRDLVLELAAKNLYHYERNIDENFEIVLPATSTKVKGMAGLEGADTIVSLVPQHTFYGCDLASDKEEFLIRYDEKEDEYFVRIAFGEGVQVAYPSECVINHKAEA